MEVSRSGWGTAQKEEEEEEKVYSISLSSEQLLKIAVPTFRNSP